MIPDLPFRPRAEIEAVQERNFSTMLDLCFERHPYYRQRFTELGLKRSDIASLADIHKIPLVDKQIYAREPDAFRLETEGLDTEMQIDWDVMHTTGTSGGKPTPFYSTTYDFYNILTTNRRALEIRGVNTDDIVANLCPMTLYPYGAYHRTIAAANTMKIPVVSPLPGRPSEHFHWYASTNEVVDCIERSRATILWGVASYVRRVLIQAQNRNADFSHVRLAFVTGERVSDALRADMMRRLTALGAVDPQVNVSYAATEMQVGTVECCAGSGFHNPAPDEFYFEIIDPESHRVLPEGEQGLTVLTHLNRRGTVLLRYLMGDSSTQSTQPCPHCGSNTDRFVQMPSRADHLVKIKGMLVDPSVLEAVVLEQQTIEEYQIRIEREDPDDALSMDTLTLRVFNQTDGAAVADFDVLAESIRQRCGVRPRVEIETAGLGDEQQTLKTQRVVDCRVDGGEEG